MTILFVQFKPFVTWVGDKKKQTCNTTQGYSSPNCAVFPQYFESAVLAKFDVTLFFFQQLLCILCIKLKIL